MEGKMEGRDLGRKKRINPWGKRKERTRVGTKEKGEREEVRES